MRLVLAILKMRLEMSIMKMRLVMRKVIMMPAQEMLSLRNFKTAKMPGNMC